VSPILIRPVREQIEHDRIVQLLQNRLRRRFDVAANVGADQVAPVKVGRQAFYPDLVLYGTGRRRPLAGVVEVETAESVNNLEAMAQWAHFGRLRAPFSLYVPAGSVDIARRLCTDQGIAVQEIWSYHTVAGETRFTLVHRAPPPPEPARQKPRRAPTARARRARPARRPRSAARRKTAAAKAKRVRARKTSAHRRPAASRSRKRKR
jgi:hypothetical protein